MPHIHEKETVTEQNSVKNSPQDDISEENSSDGNGNQVNKILFTEKVQHAIEQVIQNIKSIKFCFVFNQQH